MNKMFSAVVGLAVLLVSGPAFSADEVARNRILLNTSLAQNSEPVTVYPGWAARALGPMNVECPQPTCTIEVSAWVSLLHSPDSELFWSILVLLDEGTPEQVTLLPQRDPFGTAHRFSGGWRRPESSRVGAAEHDRERVQAVAAGRLLWIAIAEQRRYEHRPSRSCGRSRPR
jgi:hypothetical protein